jgi:dolichyl-phosphate beta-glucosyltransferase
MPYDNYERWKTTPLTETPSLSVVIPAYNEEVRIIPTIGAIASHLSDMGFPWELIIADDGSTDNTVKLVEDLGFANLHVLKAPQNGGKGSAVQRGMLAARGEYVLFSDADNSTPIEQVQPFIDALSEGGYDVAVGSRAARGAAEANKSILRHILSGGLRAIVRYALGIKVRDTQCGFKMYTREAAHRLHSAQTIMGFSFDLEVLYLAFKVGYKVTEIPVSWVDAPGSKVDTRKEVQRFLRDILKIRTTDFKGIYNRRLHDYAHRSRVNVPTG